jgi:hypothetical protein
MAEDTICLVAMVGDTMLLVAMAEESIDVGILMAFMATEIAEMMAIVRDVRCVRAMEHRAYLLVAPYPQNKDVYLA